MFDITTLGLFITTSFLLTIAPGPDIIFLITQGTSKGPKAGFQTAMGMSSGNLVHTLAAALGISIIFQTSALAFQLLKIAGVMYLLYLAYSTFANNRTQPQLKAMHDDRKRSLFWRGFLMNILNPKVALFFLAFLPQFASPTHGPVWIQMIGLGVLFTLQVVLVFGTIGLFSGKLGQLIHNDQSNFTYYMKWIITTIYISLAARLALIKQ